MDGSGIRDGQAGGAYRVLARKYRPRSFDDLVGQEPMVRTLTNAFSTGRIAQAYMLTGVRGVGKTTTARILARGLNYAVPGKVDRPTIDMPELGIHCAEIMEGRHVDVIEMDAASNNGIDHIREIIEAVRYKPVSARYKVYILDEVHMLSGAAFNGLLKTLEEPPEHVKFIFATTEIRKVPVTVLSRCQRFDLRRIEQDRLIGLLRSITVRESVEIDDEALAMIARAAEGSARDSLSLLDQAIAHGAGRIVAEDVRGMLGLADRSRVIDLFEALMAGRIAEALALIKDQYDIGAEPGVVLQDLAAFTHLVTRIKVVPGAAEDGGMPEAERRRASEFAASLPLRVLSRAWQTAQAIAEPHGLAVQPEPRLRERAFGNMEGMSFAEIEATLPVQAKRWRERDPEFEPEGGESLLTFRDRVTGVAAELAARHPGELVVLVVHGSVMDVLYRAATRQELQAPRTWQLGNAAINRMLWTPEGFSLVGWSDTAHLVAGSTLDETTT